MEMKLEVIPLPVSDVERAVKFYTSLGWRMDGDFRVSKDARLVQMTPPGSHCSVHFGSGVTKAEPGSAEGLYLIVTDLDAARDELTRLGVKVGEPFHRTDDFRFEPGLDPQRRSYFSYASFTDPDGNTWLLQEVIKRLPGRADGETEFNSESDLAGALKRAAHAHGRHEESLGKKDEHWPAWYAQFIVREQSGGHGSGRLPS